MTPLRSNPTTRRGNTMILVAGILVLLVIIATAYITRTQAGREVAAVLRDRGFREDNAQLIGDALADEIASALFAWPVDPSDPDIQNNATRVASSNYPRRSPAANALRYGVDPTDDFENGSFAPLADGFSDYPYNFAPYHVVPWTNWPDSLNPLDVGRIWPEGPGVQNGVATVNWGGQMLNVGEWNPVGGPGFGDARWLRDLEPLRWNTNWSVNNAERRDESFKYWRHLTNISRPNNGFRIVKDLSDVFGTVNADAGLVTDLRIPVEQWLTSVQPDRIKFDEVTGDTRLQADFHSRWAAWFDWQGYQTIYLQQPPSNFYNLRDLNANGVPLEFGERPQDELVPLAQRQDGNIYARWEVGRRLADTDGDGYTDAFWFLAPTPVDRGVRQVMAVSIIDNGAMFNANVATRFVPTTTAGETPADLALVGQGLYTVNAAPNWNTGFLDNLFNWEYFGDYNYNDPFGSVFVEWRPFDPPGEAAAWARFTNAINVDFDPATPPDAGDEFVEAWQRRLYWLLSGSRPLSPLTYELSMPARLAAPAPFSIADEIELRAHHGQNYPWIYSRFEGALNDAQGTSANQIIRSSIGREESVEYRDRLRNRELVQDLRHRTTLYNGARNDLMPPWLRWRWDTPLIYGNDPAAQERFLQQSLFKIDLRERITNATLDFGYRKLHERLPETILLALADAGNADPLNTYDGNSYFGEYNGNMDDDATEDLRRLSASLTANILSYRDTDGYAPLVNDLATGRIGAIPLPRWGNPTAPAEDIRFLGMEAQPFLLDAFVGHVYEAYTIPGDAATLGYTNSGDRILVEEEPGSGNALTSTVVVLQIANPFDRDLELHDPAAKYEIDFLDQTISLYDVALAQPGGTLVLPEAREDRPSTLIIFAIETSDALFRQQWYDFFDFDEAQAAGAILVDLENIPTLADAVSTQRADYDDLSSPEDYNVELVRLDETFSPPARVVVDRFERTEPTGPIIGGDEPSFGETVAELGADRPPTLSELGPIPPQAPPGPLQMAHPDGGWTMSDLDNRTHWVQWARATRGWAADYNGDGAINANERNPRYVFASKRVTVESGSSLDPRVNYATRVFRGGVAFNLANDADDGLPEATELNQPWFTAVHLNPTNVQVLSKPVFFASIDKGFYGPQRATDFGLQMLQKDADFQQVGELLNVWLWGHELKFQNVLGGNLGGASPYLETVRTFSEAMADEHGDNDNPSLFVNRLDPHNTEVLGQGSYPKAAIGYATDPAHAIPALPAAVRLLDAFVCDGVGQQYVPGEDEAGYLLGNAAGFTGRITPGLVNLNTAPVEVLRTLPHWYKLVHADPTVFDGYASRFPRTALAEAVVGYREAFGSNNVPGWDGWFFGLEGGPDYSDRTRIDTGVSTITDVRGDRGMVSIGELRLLTEEPVSDMSLLNQQATGPTPGLEDAWLSAESWRYDFAAANPFQSIPLQAIVPGHEGSTPLGTDVTGIVHDAINGDLVGGDAEEANLLVAGVSNMVTTRSDVFTVYFRVRSFVQNPDTLVWDATDPNYVIDDSRYVMLVDRSEVNNPGDKPRILYLEKLVD